jgi:hypothetical protein
MAPGLVAPPAATSIHTVLPVQAVQFGPCPSQSGGVLKKSKGLSMLIVCAWVLAWLHPVVAHGMDEHPVAVRVFNVAYLLLDARTA